MKCNKMNVYVYQINKNKTTWNKNIMKSKQIREQKQRNGDNWNETKSVRLKDEKNTNQVTYG